MHHGLWRSRVCSAPRALNAAQPAQPFPHACCAAPGTREPTRRTCFLSATHRCRLPAAPHAAAARSPPPERSDVGRGRGWGSFDTQRRRVARRTAPPPPTPPHNAKTRWGRGAHRASRKESRPSVGRRQMKRARWRPLLRSDSCAPGRSTLPRQPVRRDASLSSRQNRLWRPMSLRPGMRTCFSSSATAWPITCAVRP
jgi:hypothetical protein